MTKNTKGMSVGGKVAIGAGVAAVGAGAYYFLGPKSKQHQKKAKVWLVEMKKETEKKIKETKDMAEPVYQKIVDVIAENYGEKYKEHKNEIDVFAKKLKGEWKSIKQKNNKATKKVSK